MEVNEMPVVNVEKVTRVMLWDGWHPTIAGTVSITHPYPHSEATEWGLCWQERITGNDIEGRPVFASLEHVIAVGYDPEPIRPSEMAANEPEHTLREAVAELVQWQKLAEARGAIIMMYRVGAGPRGRAVDEARDAEEQLRKMGRMP